MYSLSGYKYFSCPYEEDACGEFNDMILSEDGSKRTPQSKPAFKKDKVCYYTIQAPTNNKEGDLIYLSFNSLENVETFVSIASEMKAGDDVV